MRKILLGILSAVFACCALCGVAALSACSPERVGNDAEEKPAEGYSVYTGDIQYRFSIASEEECPAGVLSEDKLYSSLTLARGKVYYLVLDCKFKNFNWAGEDFAIAASIYDSEKIEATLEEANTGKTEEEEQDYRYVITTRYGVPADRSAEKDYRVVYQVKITDGTLLSANFEVDGLGFSDLFAVGSILKLDYDFGTLTYAVKGIAQPTKTVAIPASYNGHPITSIAAGAFKNDSQIVSVIAGSNIAEIGGEAFCGCENLASVTFGVGSRLKTLGQKAFADCPALSSFSLPGGIEEVERGAFNKNTGLEEICLPFVGDGGGETLFGYIFGVPEGEYFNNGQYIPETLQRVEITGGKPIGDSAFYGCGSLTGITVSGEAPSIGAGAFFGCANLNEIDIPASVEKIGEAVFSGCENLEKVNISPQNTKFLWVDGALYNGDKTAILCVPRASGAFTLESGVNTVSDGAFYGCKDLDSVALHGGVTHIGDSAFYGCSGLTEIVIPAGVEEIGAGAFGGCTSLRSVTVEEGSGLKGIGDSAFYGCDALAGVYITDIGAWCGIDFFGYDSNPLYYAGKLYLDGAPVTELNIPYGTEKIGANAFRNCADIKSISIPQSVQKIGENAFGGTGYFLGAANWSGDVLYIGDCLIAAKSTLSGSYTIDGGARLIADGAFSGCGKLAGIEIPAGVNVIGAGAFSGCSSLALAEFSNGSGWSVSGGEGRIKSVDLSDGAKNAQYLAETYCAYAWRREEAEA